MGRYAYIVMMHVLLDIIQSVKHPHKILAVMLFSSMLYVSCCRGDHQVKMKTLSILRRLTMYACILHTKLDQLYEFSIIIACSTD